MRTTLFARFHRRCIVKNFGSCRNLMIWVFSVASTVFILDHFVFYSEPEKGLFGHSFNQGATEGNRTCNNAEKCRGGQISYLVESGYDRESTPTICFNGREIFSPKKKNGKRGFNLVNINGKTLEVEDVRTFDTYEDDTVFQRYCSLGIENNNIILMASADEATLHLSDESKRLIGQLGSHLVNNMNFRDSFVMIGQLNLVPPAKAVEQLTKRKLADRFASRASIKGCISVPLGAMSEPNGKAASDNNVKVATEDKIKVGDFSPNCGMPVPCKNGHIPIRLFTGSKNEVVPSICFKGKYVLGSKLNNVGRGVMVGVVDAVGGIVMRLERFDTYESKEQSNKLVAFLKEVKDTEFIFALAHDEAATALSKEAKEMMQSLGSSFFTALEFRNVWVFVGRPNIKGFSPYEDIEPSGKDTWPFSIDAKFCIDPQFSGNTEKLQLGVKKNLLKRTFCKKYDGYDQYCSIAQIDKNPAPAAQTDARYNDHAIYNVPVVLVPGLSHVSLMRQLEALITNPGIRLDMINVMYDEKFDESEDVSRLYKVKSTKLPSSTKYITLVHAALQEVWKQFPKAEHVILLEEEVIPTHDLLFFLAQCLTAIGSDETLAGVSAFNENGFKELSTDASMVLRGRTFPGFGLLLKKTFYDAHVKNNLNTCCMDRSWLGWKLPEGFELLYPDISRVSRRTYLGLTQYASFLRQYLNSPRVFYSFENSTTLSNIDIMAKASYTKTTALLLSKATSVPNNDLVKCVKDKQTLLLDSNSGSTHVIYYENSKASSKRKEDVVLVQLCVCLGVVYAPYSHLRGMHEGTLRLHYKGSQMMLVSDSSPYYQTKLLGQQPFRQSLL